MVEFQKLVWDFYKENKRDFPWREPIRHGSGQVYDPYHILVSEIMLQQTQAPRVVAYYEKFIKQFPDFKSLADAKFNEIYPLWQGLGYNRRALALQKAAQKAVIEYDGKLPQGILLLEEFPGIGPYTARAVAIFSWNLPVACIETNIRRVFIHHFFKNKKNIDDKEILRLAEQALDKENPREWHWALMDYGAYLKSLPAGRQANRHHVNYSVQSTFEGSPRQLRGGILKILAKEKTGLKGIESQTKRKPKEIKEIITAMMQEGFVKYDSKVKKYFI